MKRTTCFLSKAFKWCASKCRALVGAWGFMLPAEPTSAPARWRSFRRVALLLVFLFLLLAPTFLRPRQGAGALFFACPVKIRPYCYATGFGPTDFTYTGTCTWIPSGHDWELEFTSSGTFTPTKNVTIDLFLVGAGGGGQGGGPNNGNSGGGGGYTTTQLSVSLTSGVGYAITIGAGGVGGYGGNGAGGAGGATSIVVGGTTYTGNGGGGTPSLGNGGNGGSGGATASSSTTKNGPSGGTNGGNGGAVAGKTPGVGQGTTTGRFGNAAATKYGGGGGGGGYQIGGLGGGGGATGGGNGGNPIVVGSPGTANTGGGGGGGGGGNKAGGNGGSGICIIRNKR